MLQLKMEVLDRRRKASMTIKQEASIIGAISSVIGGGIMIWWLSSLRETWGLGEYLILCALIVVVCLLFGLWLDKKDVKK